MYEIMTCFFLRLPPLYGCPLYYVGKHGSTMELFMLSLTKTFLGEFDNARSFNIKKFIIKLRKY